MERLTKIATVLGMAIALSVFILFVISIMPHIVDQINNRWDEVTLPMSEEELMKKFHAAESYQAFIEKYPDHGRYVDLDSNGGRLELQVMNFETFDTLRLELRYYQNDGQLREEVSCQNQILDQYQQIRGSLSSQFIENVDCLSGEGLNAAPSMLPDENGNLVSEPSGPYIDAHIPECGEDTTFRNGVCIVN